MIWSGWVTYLVSEDFGIDHVGQGQENLEIAAPRRIQLAIREDRDPGRDTYYPTQIGHTKGSGKPETLAVTATPLAGFPRVALP